jgi:hypothetical protein
MAGLSGAITGRCQAPILLSAARLDREHLAGWGEAASRGGPIAPPCSEGRRPLEEATCSRLCFADDDYASLQITRGCSRRAAPPRGRC